MKVDHIIWYYTKDWHPPTDLVVLIDEGMASWDGSRWISKMPNSIGRRIDREVKQWAYYPLPPKE